MQSDHADIHMHVFIPHRRWKRYELVKAVPLMVIDAYPQQRPPVRTQVSSNYPQIPTTYAQRVWIDSLADGGSRATISASATDGDQPNWASRQRNT
jgi:hypothetical protein